MREMPEQNSAASAAAGICRDAPKPSCKLGLVRLPVLLPFPWRHAQDTLQTGWQWQDIIIPHTVAWAGGSPEEEQQGMSSTYMRQKGRLPHCGGGAGVVGGGVGGGVV